MSIYFVRTPPIYYRWMMEGRFIIEKSPKILVSSCVLMKIDLCQADNSGFLGVNDSCIIPEKKLATTLGTVRNSLYMTLNFLSPIDQLTARCEIKNVMNTTHVLGLVWRFPEDM